MFYKLTSGKVGRFQLLELDRSALRLSSGPGREHETLLQGNTDAARELRLQRPLTPGSCSLLRVSATIPSAPLCPTVDIKDQRLLVSVLDLHKSGGRTSSPLGASLLALQAAKGGQPLGGP